MNKKRRQLQQSSFLDLVEVADSPWAIQPEEKSDEKKEEVEYLTLDKVVFRSFTCPDCHSKVKLMPDGTGRCPKCIVKVPYGRKV